MSSWIQIVSKPSASSDLVVASSSAVIVVAKDRRPSPNENNSTTTNKNKVEEQKEKGFDAYSSYDEFDQLRGRCKIQREMHHNDHKQRGHRVRPSQRS